MKIVADENLAFTDYFFADIAKIDHVAGRTLTPLQLQGADALLVRSVTQVNAALLDQQTIGFVGSATIGTDHLDTQYLNEQHITWANAAGCNAQAVAEYVITALLYLRPHLLSNPSSLTLGIVGLGNVGQRLAHLAQHLGLRVIGYDPFVDDQHIEQVSFDQLLQEANAISIHVPLTQHGLYPTFHLFNATTFAQLKQDTILINSARGPVVAEQDLIADLKQTQRDVVLDVFEHEPKISKQLLDLVRIATPHIAGYSLEGKAKGTQMIYEAFCQHYHFAIEKQYQTQLPPCDRFFEGQDWHNSLIQHINAIYDIQADDSNLRACIHDGVVNQAAFDQLRKTYPLRREWASHGADLL